MMPSHLALVLKSSVTFCQSLVPLGAVAELINPESVQASTTDINGRPPLVKSSVRR